MEAMVDFGMEDMVLVSVDDHVIEPPDAFVRHFPERLKSRAPVIRSVDGADVWFWEGRRYPSIGLNAVVGRPRSEYGMEPNSYEQMRAGCHDVKARVDDMNVNGVLGSICFPTFPGFAGHVFGAAAVADPEIALAAVRAYNDWHVHDWCGAAPGRFIAMALLPLWDVPATVAEIKRMAALGVHAVSFPDNPSLVGLPSLHNAHWEPVWKALSDHEIVLNCHIGTGARAAHASDETPIDAWITTMPMSIANSAADWLHGSFWQRYPNLRMALSEGGIGWIPFYLDRVDRHYGNQQWLHHDEDFGGKLPSEVFRDHILACYITDPSGLELRNRIGIDIIAWECDYPHTDTTWPESPEFAWNELQGAACTDDEIHKITWQNATRFFDWDPFTHTPKDQATVGALRALATDVDTTRMPREEWRKRNEAAGIGVFNS
jgi:predicted TIM-barrel fold metal-dependent hydrolase